MLIAAATGTKDFQWPFETYYKWRGIFTPFDHQRRAAKHMVYRRRAFCWLDIGTGKTFTSINAMNYAMEYHGVKKVLILCPKSTLEHVWQRELFKHLTSAKVSVIKGTKPKKVAAIMDTDADIFIINHDGIRTLEPELSTIKFDLVIVDEHTAFKTWKAARTKTLRKLVEDPNTRLWMLSGEPMPQSPEDLHGPGKLVLPGKFPNSMALFKSKTMTQLNRFKWVPKPDCVDVIADMIGDSAIKVSRDECLDLPDTTFQKILVEPSKAQLKIEKQLKKDAVADIADGVITAVNEGTHMTRLLQAASGAVVKEGIDGVEPETVFIDCAGKKEALDDILESSHGPVILFCPWRAPLDMLEEHIKGKYDYHRVDGSTNDTARVAAFDAVQEGTTRILLANPHTMAHGITLTTSNTIVWWGLPYSNEVYGQANGRIIRQGQARNTHIIHLVSMSAEAKVYAALQGKAKLQGLLLDIIG
jgi:SNF2 family DNA or RNA helicase